MLNKTVSLLAYSFIFLVSLTTLSLAQNGTDCGRIEITQSLSQTITEGLACNAQGDIHFQNSFYRVFDLNTLDIQGDFTVCAVEIGIYQAFSPSGSQPITVNLYTAEPGFPNVSLTQIGTTSIELPDQNMTIVSIPVTGFVPAGSELVVEIFVPDGQADSNTFFIGTNPDGQTGPSYIQAADCGAPTPLSISDFGIPQGYVMNVIGDDLIVRNVPTLSEWGLIATAGLLGIIGFIVIRKRQLITNS